MSTKEKLDLLWKYLALIVIAILGLRFTENINSEYISNNDDRTTSKTEQEAKSNTIKQKEKQERKGKTKTKQVKHNKTDIKKRQT